MEILRTKVRNCFNYILYQDISTRCDSSVENKNTLETHKDTQKMQLRHFSTNNETFLQLLGAHQEL